MENVFSVFEKNTVYKKSKYLDEQKDFIVSKNTDEIINLMKKEISREPLEILNKDFSDYKEINFFINLKEQDIKNIFKENNKYNEFQKKYTLGREKIKFELEKEKKNTVSIPISNIEKKYAWFLEQKDNTYLQNMNYVRNHNLAESWTKDIDYLDKLDKSTYLKKSRFTNINSELKNHKNTTITKIIKLINEFKNEIKENQKEYYRQKDFGAYLEIENQEKQKYVDENEELKHNKLNYLDKFNFEYTATFEENKNIIAMLGSIGKINISNIKDFFKKVDNVDLKNEELIEKLAYAVTDKMIEDKVKENIKLYELSDLKTFNLNDYKYRDKEAEYTLERIVTLKDDFHSEFNVNDVKPITKDMKELINSRENSRKLTIPYVDYENYINYSEKDYNTKNSISDLINEYNYTNTKLEASKIKFELGDKDKILTNILMPQFEMSIITEKVIQGLDDVDTLLLDIGQKLEIPIDLALLQYINRNNPLLYNFLEREDIRKMGDDFYKNMIFDNEYSMEKNLELEKIKEFDKTIPERIKEREKVLGLTAPALEITAPELEKDINKNIELTINRGNEYTNIYENREQVFAYLREIPFISNNLRMYEETIDNNYSKIYSNLDFETNVQNALEKVFTYLIREKLENQENIDSANKLLNYIDDIEISNLEDVVKQLNEIIMKEEKEKYNKENTPIDNQEEKTLNNQETKDIDKKVKDEIEDKKEMEI